MLRLAPALVRDVREILVQTRHIEEHTKICKALEPYDDEFELMNSLAVLRDNEPLALVGLLGHEHRQDVFYAWALLGRDLRRGEMIVLHRAVMAFIAEHPSIELRAEIDEDHAEAVRWARLLGFERTTEPGEKPRCFWYVIPRRS